MPTKKERKSGLPRQHFVRVGDSFAPVQGISSEILSPRVLELSQKPVMTAEECAELEVLVGKDIARSRETVRRILRGGV